MYLFRSRVRTCMSVSIMFINRRKRKRGRKINKRQNIGKQKTKKQQRAKQKLNKTKKKKK